MTTTPAAGGNGSSVERSSAAPHVYTCNIRFSDIDAFNHVNNVEFVRYLEDARTAMLYVEAARVNGGQPFGGLVVVRHEIDYLYPLRFSGDPVRVETRTRNIRAGRFTLDYDIRDDDHHYVRAVSNIAAYDLDSASPRRLTAFELDYLRHFAAG